MTADEIREADRERQLDEIVATYMRAVDTEGPQDRSVWLQRYPGFAQDLSEFFDDEGAQAQQQAVAATNIETSRSGRQDDSVAEQTAQPVSLPETFGRYQIIRQLGQGAMGAVYLARDTQLDREVALKTPSFTDPAASQMIDRFQQEAKSAATLQHANICPIHDVGEIDGTHYITMAYIEGGPLSDIIGRKKRPSQRQIAHLVQKIALALEHAHSRGVVHRDLKPANIMVNAQHEPVVMDFGLARRTTTPSEARITQSGQILGTPAYMSPEQIRGDTQGDCPASDVYSLGVIFYELLSDALPFDGSVTAVIGQILTEDPKPPSTLRNDVDLALETICLWMMAKNVGDRCQSMKEAAQALADYLKGKASGRRKPAGGHPEADASGSPVNVTEGDGQTTFPATAPSGETSTGAAWLSSARVVRCRVKSLNERNPCRQLPAGNAGDSGETAGVKPPVIHPAQSSLQIARRP